VILCQSIGYAPANWEKLITYIEEGRLRPDNKLMENAIHPFVLGRKNWRFAKQPGWRQGQCHPLYADIDGQSQWFRTPCLPEAFFKKLLLVQHEQDLKDLLLKILILISSSLATQT
jgi:hypothetical protein